MNLPVEIFESIDLKMFQMGDANLYRCGTLESFEY